MKSWIKDWIEPNLNGHERFEMTPAQRSVWNDLRRLAAIGPVEGVIQAKGGGPPSLRSICRELRISHGLLERTLDICYKNGYVRQDEYGIHLITWEQEQSTSNSPAGQSKKYHENNDPDKYIRGRLGHVVNR